MICLALGLGILGFAAVRRARCRHYGYGHGCGGPPWHHHWHGGGGGGMGRRALFMGLSHLDASPAQERAIINEVDRLRSRLRDAKSGLKDGRGDLAAAIRSSVLDDAALGAVLGRADAAHADARSAVLEALRNIHGVLDDKQRERLADLIDNGWWRGRHGGGGGPYRV